MNDGQSNHGFLWILQIEQKYRSVFAASSDYSDPTKRPKLVVSYAPMKKYFYLKDHLGNIRVTIDENGDVKGYNDYYPFGLQMPGRSMNNALATDMYKYSSKELDEENGINWYYFGARYYDPMIGRWLSVDPVWGKYPSLSPYNYCANNPILFKDLKGAEIDSSEVKNDRAFNEVKNSDEGKKYLSEFEKGGKFEKSKLILTNKKETIGSGQMEMGYFDENGNFIRGIAPAGVQQVFIVYVDNKNNFKNTNLVSFAETVDTYLHETQHAFTEAQSLLLTGAPTVNPEGAISTYEHTMARYSLFKKINERYGYNLSNNQIFKYVTNFTGFSSKIFIKTMPSYK